MLLLISHSCRPLSSRMVVNLALSATSSNTTMATPDSFLMQRWESFKDRQPQWSICQPLAGTFKNRRPNSLNKEELIHGMGKRIAVGGGKPILEPGIVKDRHLI